MEFCVLLGFLLAFALGFYIARQLPGPTVGYDLETHDPPYEIVSPKVVSATLKPGINMPDVPPKKYRRVTGRRPKTSDPDQVARNFEETMGQLARRDRTLSPTPRSGFTMVSDDDPPGAEVAPRGGPSARVVKIAELEDDVLRYILNGLKVGQYHEEAGRGEMRGYRKINATEVSVTAA